MSREQRRNIWHTFTEVYISKLGAPALPVGADVVDCSKGETGHGSWYEGAIDFFDCAIEYETKECEGKKMKTGVILRDDTPTLEGLYNCSIADTRKPYTTDEKRIARIFWGKVQDRGLDEYGLLIMEMT